MNQFIVVVYWCLAGTSIDSFNPHQLNAVQHFIAEQSTCYKEQVDIIDEPNLDIFKCRSQQILRYMPGWLQKNPGKIYVGSDCLPVPREHLSLDGVKAKLEP